MPYYKEGNLYRTWLSPTQQAVYRGDSTETTQDEPVPPQTTESKSSNIMLWVKTNWIYIIIAIIIIVLILWYVGKSTTMTYKRSNYY